MIKCDVFVFFCLLLFITGITGCISTNSSVSPVATTSVPAVAVTQPTAASGTVITAVPATELARIQQDLLGVSSGSGSLYQFQGRLSISGGVYKSVTVIMQYTDGTEYVSDAGSMGGASPVLKAFTIYPDSRYEGQAPEFFIGLDGTRYEAMYRYIDGKIFRIATSDTAVPVLKQ
jgi:hypothetical protein